MKLIFVNIMALVGQQQQLPPKSIDRIVQLKRGDADGNSTSFSDKIANFHQLERYAEELGLLRVSIIFRSRNSLLKGILLVKADAKRFVQNLWVKKQAINQAMQSNSGGVKTLLKRELVSVEYCENKAVKSLFNSPHQRAR